MLVRKEPVQKHFLIIGPSGSGKTKLAHSIVFKEPSCALSVNVYGDSETLSWVDVFNTPEVEFIIIDDVSSVDSLHSFMRFAISNDNSPFHPQVRFIIVCDESITAKNINEPKASLGLFRPFSIIDMASSWEVLGELGALEYKFKK